MNTQDDHSVLMGPLTNPMLLDLSSYNFEPTVTSTSVTANARDDLINKALELKEPCELDMDALEEYLLKMQRTQTDITIKEDILPQSEFSKLSILTYEEMDDKCVDRSNLDLSDRYFQPKLIEDDGSIISYPFDNTSVTVSTIMDQIPDVKAVSNGGERNDEEINNLPDINIVASSPPLFQDLGSSVNFDSDSEMKHDILNFTKEAERIWEKQNPFHSAAIMGGDSSTNFSFSEQDAEDVISISSSIVTTPIKKLIQPGNKIKIKDYLQAKSCPLGDLNDNHELPSFGMGPTRSPSKTDLPALEIEEVPIPQSINDSENHSFATEVANPVQSVNILQEMLNESTKLSDDAIKKISGNTERRKYNVDQESYSKKVTELEYATAKEKKTNYPVVPVEKQPLVKHGLQETKVIKEKLKSIMDSIPMKIEDTGIVSLATELTLNIENPLILPLTLKMNKLKDTLNNKVLPKPALSFKANYAIQPSSPNSITIFVCSAKPGIYYAVCQLVLGHPSGDSVAKNIHIIVNIKVPNVSVTCAGSQILNLGLVPEGCLYKKEIVIQSNSKSQFPVKVSTSKFKWDLEESRHHLISEKCFAAEIIGTEPIKCQIEMKIPDFPNEKDRNTMVYLKDEVVVELDCPYGERVSLGKMKILGQIGRVSLWSSKTVLPLKVEAHGNGAYFPIKNSSTFDVSLQCHVVSDMFTVSPHLVAIGANQEEKLHVTFQPNTTEPNIDSKLCLKVIPDGLILEIAVCGYNNPKHQKLTSTVSAPIGQTHHTTKNLKLVSSKQVVAFGTAPMGQTVTEQLILINGWVDESLTLSVVLAGDKVFQVKMNDVDIGDTIVLAPSTPSTLVITFNPNDVKVYKGSLIFKPTDCGSNAPSFTVPLQGFGGSCTIHCGAWKVGEPISLLYAPIERSSSASAIITNKGDRSMFVKFCLEPGDGEALLTSIYPESMRLAPGESFFAMLMTSVTPNYDETRFSRLGKVKLIYGDEILLKRFKKAPKQHVPLRKLKNPTLVKEGLNTLSFNEECIEEDDLLILDDEAKLFYNHCKQIVFDLNFKMEDSMNTAIFEPPTQDISEKKPVKASPPKPSSDLVVLPQSVHMYSTDKQNVSIGNSSNHQLMVQIVWSCQWLQVTPKEFVIKARNFALVELQVDQNLLCGKYKIYKTTIEIIYDNGSQKIDVEVTQSNVLRQANAAPKLSSQTSKGIMDKENCHAKNTLKFDKEMQFGSAKCGRELVKTLSISNTGTHSEPATLAVKGAQFSIRHEKFIVKAGCSVKVPVSFCPDAPGKAYKGELKLKFESQNLAHSICLKGKSYI